MPDSETLKECGDYCAKEQFSKYFIFGKTAARCNGKLCKCYCEGYGPNDKCTIKSHNYYNIYKITEQ